MSHSPTVSVIIATYNSSHTLRYTIKSLLNQTFQDFEAWIIGDCCTDDTKELIDSFNDSRLYWYNRAENSGSQPAPNNEGLIRSKGKYIAYLGHDDLWLPHHLKELISHVENKQLHFTYAITVHIAPNGIEYVRGKRFIGLCDKDFVSPPSSWLHKKDLIDKIGFWDEDYLKLARPPDADFYSRVASSGIKIEPSKKLTVIKFPSPSWKSYKNKIDITDAIESYWTRISKNPINLELELLNAIAFEYSKFHLQGMILPMNVLLKMIKKNISLFLKNKLYCVGVFRYIYLKRSYYKYRKSRTKGLKKRGLNLHD